MGYFFDRLIRLKRACCGNCLGTPPLALPATLHFEDALLGPHGLPERSATLSNTGVFARSSGTSSRPGLNTYLLGLLAMIKCSICSYQCDN